MRTQNLLTDHLREPLGLDATRPVFSFSLVADHPGERQIGYQLLVSSERRLLAAGTGDLWDSGRVQDERPFAIRYAGAKIPPRLRAFWVVRVWNQDEEVSPWSEVASWESGMLGEPWGAMWVGSPPQISQTVAPRFVTEFTIEDVAGILDARIRIAGLGLFTASLNGAPLARDVFAPGESDFSRTVYYVTYDVRDLLRQGANALGVTVGNGQFVNFLVNPVMRTPLGEPSPFRRYQKDDAGYVRPGLYGAKRMTARVELTQLDGTITVLAPAVEDWEVTAGPVTFNDWYGGEDFDATRDEAGWDLPGTDRSGWFAAVAMEAPRGRLRGRDFPPAVIVEQFPAESVTLLPSGNLLVDMGRNVAGFPEITLHARTVADRGTTITMRPAELLNTDGSSVDQSSCTQSASEQLGCSISLSYTMAGTGEERWHPRFCYQGFRYVEVSGWTGDPGAMSWACCVVRIANERSGSFATSHVDLNAIARLTDRSIESNMFFSFTDCPQIEKLGWLETSHLMLPSIAVGYDIRSWIPKVVRDVTDAQTTEADRAQGDPEPAGYVPAIAPEYHRIVGLHRDPNWGGACILTPWEHYRFYGDPEVLHSAFPTMQAYLGHLRDATTDGLLDGYAQMGDWGEIDEKTPVRLVENCAYVRLLRAASSTAMLLGRDSDARRYGENAQAVVDGIHRDPGLFRADGAIYGNGSQASYGCVLFSEVVPFDRHREALANLVRAVETRDDHLSSGEVGLKQVLASLARGGRSDVVLRMVLNRTAPSYKVFVDAGLSTLPEYWNYDAPWHGMARSRNHAMMGHVREWLTAYVLGIRATSHAFRTIAVAPSLTRDVRAARGSVRTSYGDVAARYHLGSRGYSVRVILPVGVAADIALPIDETAIVHGWDGYAHSSTRWVSVTGAGVHQFDVGQASGLIGDGLVAD